MIQGTGKGLKIYPSLLGYIKSLKNEKVVTESISERKYEPDNESKYFSDPLTSPSPVSSKPRRPLTKEVSFVRKGASVFSYSDLDIQDEIGSGSFGSVYKAILNNKPVAIKITKVLSPKLIEDFHKEADLMVNIGIHPNVTCLYGICLHEGRPILILEYCGKGSLRSFLDDVDDGKEKMEFSLEVSIIKGCANGMLHLHSVKTAHRDLAARNILLTDDFTAKVADFGMSRIVKENELDTTVGSGIFPIKWMAPESIAKKFSLMSDVWSFGVLTWEILTKQRPHEDKEVFEVAIPIRDTGLTPDMTQLPKNINPFWPKLLQSCWQMKAEDRPTMKDIVSKLENYK